MKSLWVREVREIVESDVFLEWWRSLQKMEQQLGQLNERHEELLSQAALMEYRTEFIQRNATDSLYLAGEYEDNAAEMLANASELENKSYEAVADFENQRIFVSDLYTRMGACEHELLSTQSSIQILKKSIESEKDSEKRAELERNLKSLSEALSKQERELKEASATYERENNRKMSLWEEVELIWSRGLNINLSVSEYRVRSNQTRRAAQRKFAEAENSKQNSQKIREEVEDTGLQIKELEKAIENKRKSARKLFYCTVGENFIFWPRRENIKEVYCVPLADFTEGYNIELIALTIYLVNQKRGVEFIQLLPPDTPQEEEDKRIDDFFVLGRPR
jgi:tetratricopeptide (TPR) repeat protein